VIFTPGVSPVHRALAAIGLPVHSATIAHSAMAASAMKECTGRLDRDNNRGSTIGNMKAVRTASRKREPALSSTATPSPIAS